MIQAAEAIAQPGANAGSTTQLITRLRKNYSRFMIDLFGKHTLHDTDVVYNTGCMGNQIAQVSAFAAVPGKCGGRAASGKLF